MCRIETVGMHKIPRPCYFGVVHRLGGPVCRVTIFVVFCGSSRDFVDVLCVCIW